MSAARRWPLESRTRQRRVAGYRALLSALYADDHPYRFPLAGTEASCGGFGPGRSGEFSRTVSCLARATIVVAGDVDAGRSRRRL